MPSLSVIRVGATGVVFFVFLAAAVVSLNSFGRPTYWFPAFIAVGGTLASAYSFARDLRKVMAGESVVDDEITDLGASVTDTHGEGEEAGEPQDQSALRKRMFAWVLWLVALPALGLVIPFFYASLIWLAAVLRFYARRGWLFTVVSVGIFGVVLNVLVVLLEIRLPPAILTGLG
jgi:hypothetical protein